LLATVSDLLLIALLYSLAGERIFVTASVGERPFVTIGGQRCLSKATTTTKFSNERTVKPQ